MQANQTLILNYIPSFYQFCFNLKNCLWIQIELNCFTFPAKRYWGSVHYKFSESWVVSKWKWGHDQSKVWLKRKFYCRYESKCNQSHLRESREGEKRINMASRLSQILRGKKWRAQERKKRGKIKGGDKDEKHIPEMTRLHNKKKSCRYQWSW